MESPVFGAFAITEKKDAEGCESGIQGVLFVLSSVIVKCSWRP